MKKVIKYITVILSTIILSISLISCGVDKNNLVGEFLDGKITEDKLGKIRKTENDDEWNGYYSMYLKKECTVTIIPKIYNDTLEQSNEIWIQFLDIPDDKFNEYISSSLADIEKRYGELGIEREKKDVYTSYKNISDNVSVEIYYNNEKFGNAIAIIIYDVSNIKQ